MKKIAVLILLLAGCGGNDTTQKPNQWEAVTYIYQTLGMHSEAPTIVWVDPDPTCTPSPCIWAHPVTTTTPILGVYEYDSDVATVMWSGSISGSALTHEMIHAWQFKDRGIADSTHLIKQDWDRVPIINKELLNIGL